MRRWVLPAAALLAIVVLSGCGTDRRASLQTRADSLSYAVGSDIGGRFRMLNPPRLDIPSLAQGVRDTLAGGPIKLSPDELSALLKEFSSKLYAGGADHGSDTMPLTWDVRPVTTLETHEQKTCYAAGVDMGGNFVKTSIDIRVPALMQGLVDTLNGHEPMLSKQLEIALLRELAASARNETIERKREEAQRNADSAAAFIAAQAQLPNTQTTPAGVLYRVLEQGSGRSPGPKDRVLVRYRLFLHDGSLVDSSVDGGRVLRVEGTVRGLVEALQLMRESATWEIVVPPELGYGAGGRPDAVPANMALRYELTLLKIVR